VITRRLGVSLNGLSGGHTMWRLTPLGAADFVAAVALLVVMAL